ncbi:MAG: restriction endonuclease [Phycisphaerae bacterium]|nr:restriction endonuclease [Phycisphaerae bacterium]
MNPRIIELPEYEARTFAKDEITEHTAKVMHDSFGSQIQVEPPSLFNMDCWRLTSQGWVGYIPLAEDLHVSLTPKVPIRNLFGMLEYAYRLDFKILEGMADSESIAELYERLALVLAKRILDRIRQGLYRSYVGESASLPYVRGRLDVLAHVRNPASPVLPCHFEDHTADLEENQILLWTLTRILEGGICSERSLPYIRQARRVLQGFARPCAFSPQKCIGRLYNRLNQDYEPLHALCRFFLEHSGPTHRLGDRRMIPILVDMERLFELFVVEWMKRKVEKLYPERYIVRGQENIQFQMGQTVSIRIDITVEDIATGKTCLVLDTKYKAPDQPAPADIHQVVAYAEAKDCRRAILIYPTPLPKPIQGLWGNEIRVQSLVFPLDKDLDQAGTEFLRQLFAAS